MTVTQRLAETERTVIDAVIKDESEKGLKHAQKSVAYRMRKALQNLRVLKYEQYALAAAARDVLVTHPAIIEVIRVAARELGGSHKRAGNHSIEAPIDGTVIPKSAGRGSGGAFDKLLQMVNGWLSERENPTTIARGPLHKLLKHANVSFGTVKETFTEPRLGQHYCAAHDLTMESLGALFSGYVVRMGADAKTVFKCNASHNAHKGREIQIDSEHNTTVSANAGKDTQGKLNLFSMMIFGVTDETVSTLLPDDFVPDESIDGYTAENCFWPRSPLACQLGHIQDFCKETATRNFADIYEMYSRFPKHVIDMKNNVAPILMLELDGGHGAREKVTRFVAGILWWLLDLDVLAEYENEGGWSKARQIEKMNGATARATNGNPVYIPCPSAEDMVGKSTADSARASGHEVHADIDKESLLGQCIKKLVKVADQQVFNMGGGVIQAFVARFGAEVDCPPEKYPDKFEAPDFEFVHDEIKAFITGKDRDRAAFLDRFPAADERVKVYRAVYDCYKATGDQQQCFKTAHSVTWMKLPNSVRPRRAPPAFYSMLAQFDGRFPQPVPSIDYPFTETCCRRPHCRREGKHCCGHFMRLDERLRPERVKQMAVGEHNAADFYYPEAVFPLIDTKIGLLDALCADDSGDSMAVKVNRFQQGLMAFLEEELRNPAEDIERVLSRGVAKRRKHDLLEKMAKQNEDSGVEKAVIAFVRQHREASNVEDLVAVLKTLKRSGDDLKGLRCELVYRVYIAAQLNLAEEERSGSQQSEIPSEQSEISEIASELARLREVSAADELASMETASQAAAEISQAEDEGADERLDELLSTVAVARLAAAEARNSVADEVEQPAEHEPNEAEPDLDAVRKAVEAEVRESEAMGGMIDVVFVSNIAEDRTVGRTIQLFNGNDHIVDLSAGVAFLTKTLARRRWSVRCDGCTLLTWTMKEAGMFTVPMDFALPIVRAQRGNRGIAKEKLDPVAEAAKPQWDHKK